MRNRNEERIVRRQTTWHAINIKARRDQNSAHYVHAFRSLQDEDPLVELSRNRCESLKSVTYSKFLMRIQFLTGLRLHYSPIQ